MVEFRDQGGIEGIFVIVADDRRQREADFIACPDEMREFIQRFLNVFSRRTLQAEDDFVQLLKVLRREEIQKIDAVYFDGPTDGLRRYDNFWFPIAYGVANLLGQCAEIIVQRFLDVFRRTAAQFIENGRRDEKAVRIIDAQVRQ